MIETSELRLGNYILHKAGVRILPVKCGFQHFDLLSKGLAKDMFPIKLKTDLLQKCGFTENTKYYQLPEGREFILTLPVTGNSANLICAYFLANSEPFARAMVNELFISNNLYHLHQLQNLFYALTGAELEITL